MTEPQNWQPLGRDEVAARLARDIPAPFSSSRPTGPRVARPEDRLRPGPMLQPLARPQWTPAYAGDSGERQSIDQEAR